jgi:hypothetical protein
LQWEIGDRVEYAIEREGQFIKHQVELGKLPARAILSRYWGAILFGCVSQDVGLFVREQVEVEQLTRKLAEVVEEALHPEKVLIWLRPIRKGRIKLLS